MLVARFTPQGTPDTTFGNGGTSEVKYHLPAYLEMEDNAVGEEIAVAPDGGIVLGGGVRLSGYASDTGVMAVVRFNKYGRLDRSFANQGRYVNRTSNYRNYKTPFGQSAMTIDGAGRIVFGGGVSVAPHKNPAAIESGLGLERFTLTGSLDTRFGHGGIVGARRSG